VSDSFTEVKRSLISLRNPLILFNQEGVRARGIPSGRSREGVDRVADACQIQALRRADGAAGGAVAGVECGPDVVIGPLTATGLFPPAGDGPDLIGD
jgi:hypothetical protein